MDIKSIGVLTSGGDAPGMNAAIRAVTRAAIYEGWKVYGIYRGWEGLISGDIKEFTSSSVSNTIQRGGTILKTARSEEFRTKEGRAKAAANIKKFGIDALVIIGGNGSLEGAQILAREYDIPVIGLPGTIDNDLYGTDSTIGYDTALNTIVECVDKIRDTANSHDRIFFVEVMGRDAGFLTQNSAIAAGAEAAIIPDMHYAERVRQEYPEYQVKVSILGHLQRGGAPTAQDRILASRLGVASIEALKEGQRNIMVGIKNDQIVYVPISRAVRYTKPIDKELINVLSILSI